MSSPAALPFLLSNDYYVRLQQQLDAAFGPAAPAPKDEPLPWDDDEEESA